MRRGKNIKIFYEYKLDFSWDIGPLLLCLLSSCCCIITLFRFQKVLSNLGTRYCQHDTCNLKRVRNVCTMVAKPGTIVLIMKNGIRSWAIVVMLLYEVFDIKWLWGEAFSQASEIDGGLFEDKNPDIKMHSVSYEKHKRQDVRRTPGLKISSCRTYQKLLASDVLKCALLHFKIAWLLENGMDKLIIPTFPENKPKYSLK